MSVTEQDVRDLLKRYPNPKGLAVGSIAYHIPCTQRNLEIVDAMSKFIGPISKRWRGPRKHGKYSWNQDLPREYAERVSIYVRGNGDKYTAFMEGKSLEEAKIKRQQEQIDKLRESFSEQVGEKIKYWGKAHAAKQLLENNVMDCGELGVVVMSGQTYDELIEYLEDIINHR